MRKLQPTEVLTILDAFQKNIRLESTNSAKKTFVLLLENIDVTPRNIHKIYDVCEVFQYFEPDIYVEMINDYLEKKESYFLRLIRQEMMYNSENYNIDDLEDINKDDLKKYSDNPEFLNFRGVIYLEQEEYNQSLKYFNKALIKQPENITYLRNKATAYVELNNYEHAKKIVQLCLGFEPKNEELISDLEYIVLREKGKEEEDKLTTIEKRIDEHTGSIKNIKFDFIAISGIFVAVLTIVIRMITFDYNNFETLDFWEIIKYQIAINIPWLLSLILVLLVLLRISFKK